MGCEYTRNECIVWSGSVPWTANPEAPSPKILEPSGCSFRADVELCNVEGFHAVATWLPVEGNVVTRSPGSAGILV